MSIVSLVNFLVELKALTRKIHISGMRIVGLKSKGSSIIIFISCINLIPRSRNESKYFSQIHGHSWEMFTDQRFLLTSKSSFCSNYSDIFIIILKKLTYLSLVMDTHTHSPFLFPCALYQDLPLGMIVSTASFY